MKFNKTIATTLLTLYGLAGIAAQEAPKPFGSTPNERQKEWYDREMIAFFHFGINTFEDFVNEGDGKAPAAILTQPPLTAPNGWRP